MLAQCAQSERSGRCRVRQLVRVFFFQAEDGIRDYKVTGVQTCALPILLVRQLQVSYRIAYRVGRLLPGLQRGEIELGLNIDEFALAVGVAALGSREHFVRSEERRVGKECRSRWSPYH